MLNRLLPDTPADELAAIADQVRGLRYDFRDPEQFYEQRSEVAGALVRLSTSPPRAMPIALPKPPGDRSTAAATTTTATDPNPAASLPATADAARRRATTLHLKGDRPMPTLTARALKCTLVLDAAEIARIPATEGTPRIPFRVLVDGRAVTADIAAKSVRKAQATIAEHGPEAVAAILQGKLTQGDVLAEAGLVVQPKVRPAAQPAQAAA